MAGYGKNSEVIGAVLLLLFLGRQQTGIFPGKIFSPGAGSFQDLAGTLRLGDFARDMHRLVDMMDQMANLGQMAGLMQTSGLAGLLPQPDHSHVSGAANAVSSSMAGALPDMKLPDMKQLMEMTGPLMEMLSSQNQNYNK